MNTRINVSETDFSIYNGLFADNFNSPNLKKTAGSGEAGFLEFTKRIGIINNRAQIPLSLFQQKQQEVDLLIRNSYLDETVKRAYVPAYCIRRNQLLRMQHNFFIRILYRLPTASTPKLL